MWLDHAKKRKARQEREREQAADEDDWLDEETLAYVARMQQQGAAL